MNKEIDEQEFTEMVEREQEACYLLGRFTQVFSQLEFTLKFRITRQIGLPDVYFDAVLGKTPFAALVTMLSEVMLAAFPDDAKDGSVFQSLLSRVRRLNEQRVDVAHSTWVPGSDGLVARKVSSKFRSSYVLGTREELRRLVDETSRLNDALIAWGPARKPPVVNQAPDGST